MYQTTKIPELIDPQATYTTNGQEAWRVLGIMAEFAAATETVARRAARGVDVRQRAHQARSSVLREGRADRAAAVRRGLRRDLRRRSRA